MGVFSGVIVFFCATPGDPLHVGLATSALLGVFRAHLLVPYLPTLMPGVFFVHNFTAAPLLAAGQ